MFKDKANSRIIALEGEEYNRQKLIIQGSCIITIQCGHEMKIISLF